MTDQIILVLYGALVFVGGILMLLYLDGAFSKKRCSHASETNTSWIPAPGAMADLVKQAGLGQYVEMTMLCDQCGNERKTFGFVKDWIS